MSAPDAESAALLAARAKAGIPPVSGRSPADIRAEREAWRQKVAATPLPLHEVRDIPVAVPGGTIHMRLYRAVPETRPAVLYFHGGGWVLGDLDHSDAYCRRLARESGLCVVSVDYRLAPEHRFPTALEDGLAALAALRACPPEGLDAGRIAIAGASAGGNLAAATVLALRERGLPPAAAQVLAYPALEAACTLPSYTTYGDGYIVSTEDMRWYWQQYLGGGTAGPLACPLRADDLSDLPPTLVVTAGCDPLRDDGETYHVRLVSAGVDSRLHRYDGVLHGFLTMLDTITRAEEALAEVAGYLSERLTTP